MYCKNCGRELKKDVIICPYCKQKTRSETSYTCIVDEETLQTNKVDKKEKFSFSFFGLLSILLGIVGLGFGIFGMFQILPFSIFAGVASLGGFICSLLGIRETLKLYKNGLVVSYIGFFISVTGIFLTVAAIVMKLLG